MSVESHTTLADARMALETYLWNGSDRADVVAKRGQSEHEGARDAARAEVHRVAALACRAQCFQLAVQRRMIDARSGDDRGQASDAFGGPAPAALTTLTPYRRSPSVRGVSPTFATPWRNEDVFLPPAVFGNQLVHGRQIHLAVFYEIHAQTRLTVKEGPGKLHMPDLHLSVAVLPQTLKVKGMLVQAVIEVLEKHAVGFAAPIRCFALSWRVFGCAQAATAQALAVRPLVDCRAPRKKLVTFFRGTVIRQSKLQMCHVFKTALGGAPLIGVRERVVGADPLSECLAMRGRALSALETAHLELSAHQEGGRQSEAALSACAPKDSTVQMVAYGGTLARLSPARVVGHPAQQARHGIAYDEMGGAPTNAMILDEGRTGAVTVLELKIVLQTKFHAPREEGHNISRALDHNHDEEIHYSDFLAAMVGAKIGMHEDHLRSAFAKFDVDNSRYITRENLREVPGDACDSEAVDGLLAEKDFLRDGSREPSFAVAFGTAWAMNNNAGAVAKTVDRELEKSSGASRQGGLGLWDEASDPVCAGLVSIDVAGRIALLCWTTLLLPTVSVDLLKRELGK
ncbi:unnamed protein product [Prorocentrum cordatum]|uniref:EF-hand domain-containing protein n=1 Tax=Prorocentrum cordatum TaxID=2364126 RepID=A0ABN9UCJ1_9DINO|nr:unnamed protein product [Polarella glacialis]